MQNESSFDGARVMGVDVSNQIILASGKAPGVGGEHVLRKVGIITGKCFYMIVVVPVN